MVAERPTFQKDRGFLDAARRRCGPEELAQHGLKDHETGRMSASGSLLKSGTRSPDARHVEVWRPPLRGGRAGWPETDTVERRVAVPCADADAFQVGETPDDVGAEIGSVAMVGRQ